MFQEIPLKGWFASKILIVNYDCDTYPDDRGILAAKKAGPCARHDSRDLHTGDKCDEFSPPFRQSKFAVPIEKQARPLR